MSTFQVTSRVEAVTRHTETEETQVATLVATIEQAIKGYSGEKITCYVQHECSAKAIARVAGVYRQAGWTVVCGEGDQHDPGAWMSFV